MTHRCASPSPRPSKLRANMTRQSTRASRYCEPMCVPVRVASRGVYCMCMARIASALQGPSWSEGKAKTLCLRIFESLGASHPVVSTGRKRLSKILFR